MAGTDKIGVGVVGASPSAHWTKGAHIPALKALPDFELAAVCTTRQESADEAARLWGARHAFTSAASMAASPAVDVVAVSVKVPDHYAAAMAAIDAGKPVYCEWPLGRNTDEAIRLRDAAKARGVPTAVGLQARVDPALCFAKDLIEEGFIGNVLSASMYCYALDWGPTIGAAYKADFANGANLLTIQAGHSLDALCFLLGEFTQLSALAVNQRDKVPLTGTGELVAKNVPDQLAVAGIIGDDIVISLQVHGGKTKGTPLFLEIHGDKGDLVIPSSEAMIQFGRLRVHGPYHGGGMINLMIPARYFWIPPETERGWAYNVAQMYAKFGAAIRSGGSFEPGFERAVALHRLLDKVMEASNTGQRLKL